MVCFKAVDVSVTDNLEPGMAAPAGSVTVPNRLPPSLANKIQPEKQNRSNAFHGVCRSAM
jgi:hypothetical protein